ncbi:MAG: MmcQ/YjbR family DNA-binding protein [Massilia sp.]
MNVETARALCRTFPGCTEDLKWGHVIVYSVGTKMFATCPHEPKPLQMSFKVEDERFLELTDRPGIVPAPYLARMKWVQVKAAALSDAEAAGLLRRAYELVFARLTKKLQREIGGA